MSVRLCSKTEPSVREDLTPPLPHFTVNPEFRRFAPNDPKTNKLSHETRFRDPRVTTEVIQGEIKSTLLTEHVPPRVHHLASVCLLRYAHAFLHVH